MLPLTVDSLVITVADCLFVTGIKQNLNEFIIEHILLFIILMLYVYQRHNLNSSILHDDNNLQIPGYNLCREDHPFSINEEVFVFARKFLFFERVWPSKG